MTGTTSDTTPERATGESGWALPLLALIPAAVLRTFTELSTPWLIASWAFVALSVALVIAAWTTTIRRGMPRVQDRLTCLLTHVVLVLQVLRLIQE
ncbi:hypothetical protein ACVNF4_01925 [Streptomyces sp. S6]